MLRCKIVCNSSGQRNTETEMYLCECSCYCRRSLQERCRSYDAESMQSRQLMHDAKSAARIATQKVNSLTVKLSAEKASRDEVDEDLRVAQQLVRERTASLMQCFDQSIAVEVSVSVVVTCHRLLNWQNSVFRIKFLTKRISRISRILKITE